MPIQKYSTSELLKPNSLQAVLKPDYVNLWNGLLPARQHSYRVCKYFDYWKTFYLSWIICPEKCYPFSNWKTYGWTWTILEWHCVVEKLAGHCDYLSPSCSPEEWRTSEV